MIGPEDFLSLNILGRGDPWNILAEMPVGHRLHLRRVVRRVARLVQRGQLNRLVPLQVIKAAFLGNLSYGVAMTLALYRERLLTRLPLLPCDATIQDQVGERLAVYPHINGHGVTLQYYAQGEVIRSCSWGVDGHHTCH